MGHRRPEGVDLQRPLLPVGLRGRPHRARLAAPPRALLPAGAASTSRASRSARSSSSPAARSSTRSSSPAPAPTPTWSSVSPARAGASRWGCSASSAASRRWLRSSTSPASSTGGRARQDNGAIDDPVMRDRLAGLKVELKVMRVQRAARALRRGRRRRLGGRRGSGLDLQAGLGQLAPSLGELAMDGRAARPACSPPARGYELDEWQRLFLFSRADTIYGGSDEIQQQHPGRARARPSPRTEGRLDDAPPRRAARPRLRARPRPAGRQGGRRDRGGRRRHRRVRRTPGARGGREGRRVQRHPRPPARRGRGGAGRRVRRRPGAPAGLRRDRRGPGRGAARRWPTSSAASTS